MNGRFITFEGGEGSGKTTQIALLEKDLEAAGRDVLVTQEPGGGHLGRAIRQVLLDPRNREMAPVTELLLYTAARAQHVEEVIRPALEAGRIVLSDRFADSTTAYQGGGRGLPRDWIEQMHRIATRGVWPDLTILLDVPPAVGLARAAKTSGPDRLEREPIEFHERVREAFLELARAELGRIRVIDGTLPVEQVAARIRAYVDELLQHSP